MKYKVIIHNEALKELNSFGKSTIKKLSKDYEKIQYHGMEFIDRKHVENDIYEIRTDRYRSLFAYKNDQVVVIAVIFIKKTQKTPEKFKNLAKMRLKDYE